jgi:predicted PurR-regulated permease PerM
MTFDTRSLAHWLTSGAIILALLVLGQTVLIPLLFAVVLWSLLNSLAEHLQKLKIPNWLALSMSLVAIVAAFYVIARILGSEAVEMMDRGPEDVAKLQTLVSGWLAFLKLGHSVNVSDLISRADATGLLVQTASSTANFVFYVGMVTVFLGFLLAEQHFLPTKIANLVRDEMSRAEVKEMVHSIADQLQSYIGVCTLLSGIMAATTYVLLAALGIDFAGFWALIMFLLTYIPTIGALGVVLPATMGLVQFGSLEIFFLVTIVLGGMHLFLANVVQTIMLGRSLNLSALGIILSLSFWGLVWGVSGLFLAIPLVAATVIICQHVDGLHWVATAFAGPPPREKHERRPTRRNRTREDPAAGPKKDLRPTDVS